VLLLFLGIAQTHWFKNIVKSNLISYCDEKFDLKMSINSLEIDYFDFIKLDNLYIPGKNNDTLIYADQLSIDYDLQKLIRNQIELDRIVLDGGSVHIGVPENEESLNIQFLIDAFKPKNQNNSKKIHPFTIQHLELKNSLFSYFDDNKEAENEEAFDQNNIRCRNIDATFKEFVILGDSLNFTIERLTTIERSGLFIQNLSANTTISSTTLKFEDLKLKTPLSYIEDFIAFRYSDYHDFSDFNNRVLMEAALSNSFIHTDDISIFTHKLSSYHDLLSINGDIKGTVNHLTGKKMNVSLGDNIHFDGELVMKDITNPDKSYFIIDAKKIETSTSGIKRYLNNPQQFNELDYLKTLGFNGKYKGGFHDFNIDGELTTNVGNILATISFDDTKETPIFKGIISSSQIQLGKILSNPSFNQCKFNLAFEGKGSSMAELNAQFKGSINHISYNDISYKNTEINGKIEDKLVSCMIKNQGLEEGFTMNTTLNFQNEIPSIIAKTDIKKINFRLGLNDTTEHAISCKGDLKLSGNTLNTLDGNINLEQINYSINKKIYPFKFLQISKKITEEQQIIKLNSDQFELAVLGDYIPSELSLISQKLIHSIDPIDHTLLDSSLLSESLELTMKVHENNPFIPMLVKKLSIESGFLTLSYNIQTGKISNNNNLIGLRYDNISAPHIIANVHNERDSSALNFNISTGGLLQNDSSLFDLFELKGVLKKNVIHFSNISKKGKALDIDIKGRAIYQSDSIKIYFDQSKVKVDEKPWVLRPVSNPNIVLHEGTTEFLYFDFRHANEILFVDASLGDQANKANAIISNFELENINPFIAGFDLKFHGLVNGYVDISDRDGFPIIETNLSIEKLQMDNDTLGDLEISSENAKGLAVSIDGSISNGILNQMKITGAIDFENKKSPLDLKLKTQKSSIKPFEKYLSGLMSNVSGFSTTDISVTGPLKTPKLDGTMYIDSLNFTMDYLQTNYTGDATIKINYSSFHISEAQIIDRYSQKGNITGNINHRNFHDFKLDLDINQLQNFEIMNTSRGDNSLFYGSAFIDGSAKISGPVDDIFIQVNAKSRKGTVIEIPLDDLESDHTLSYVEFVDLKKDLSKKKTFKSTAGIQMDFNFEVTNDAEVKLIFDELLGDKIEASSHGNLRMEINTFGDFNMYGGLTIDKGNYLFTAFDLINKFFVVKPGGTLRWDGNPYNAKIDLEAIKREYPTPLPLLSGTLSSAEDSTLFQTAIPADCYLKLEGLLFNPDVTFDLGFPSQTNLNTNTNSTLNTIINRIRLDQEELNRQVFALLVLGTFIPPSFANSSSPELSVGAVNTGINSFSDFASSQINNWLGQLDTRFQLGVDYQTSYQKKAELILSLRRKFLNDRLELSYSTDAAAQGSIPYDISVKYTIGDDGNLKVQGFQKQANDPTIGSITNVRTTGVGLFYRYQFDKFRLRRRKKKSATKSN
jgi:hypothetical protein